MKSMISDPSRRESLTYLSLHTVVCNMVIYSLYLAFYYCHGMLESGMSNKVVDVGG